MTDPRSFSVRVRNLDAEDENVVLPGKSNRLAVDLCNRSGRTLDLRPMFRFDGGSAFTLQFDATLSMPEVQSSLSGDGFAAPLTGWRRLARTAPLSLAPLDIVTILISDLVIPLDYPAPTVALGIGWSGVFVLGDQGAGEPLDDGGRAVVIDVRAPHRRRPGLATQPPVSADWLTAGLGPMAAQAGDGIVAVSPSMSALIPNRLALHLRNTGDAALGGTDAKAKPTFHIGWLWSFDDDARSFWRSDAMMTMDLSRKLQIGIGAGDQARWRADWVEGGFHWQLTPLTPEILPPHTGLVVTFDNVFTTMAGLAAFHLSWRDVPGYADGRMVLPIRKVPAWPVISRFEADCGAAPFVLGDAVRLSWNTWGTPPDYPTPVTIIAETLAGSEILGVDLPPAGTLSHVPSEEFTHYRLTMPVPNAPADARARARLGRATASLSADRQDVMWDNSFVALSFEYSFFSRVTLAADGVDVPIQAERTGNIRTGQGTTNVFPGADTTYTLSVEGFGGPATASVPVRVRPTGSKPFDCYFVIGSTIHQFHGADLSVSEVGPLPGGATGADVWSFDMWPDPVVVLRRDLPLGTDDWRPVTYIPRGPDLFPLYARSLDNGGWWFEAEVRDAGGKAPDWGRRFMIRTGTPMVVRRIANLGFDGWLFDGSGRAFLIPVGGSSDGMKPAFYLQNERTPWGGSFDVTSSGNCFFLGSTPTDPPGLYMINWFDSGSFSGVPHAIMPRTGVSTRLAMAHDDTCYWVENDGPRGPVLCRFLGGVQTLAQLPGRVDFNCLALAPEGRVPLFQATRPFAVIRP